MAGSLEMMKHDIANCESFIDPNCLIENMGDAWEACEEAIERIAELESQVETLQNRCANRGLSPEDSDALQAENERLEAALQRTHELIKAGRYQAADAELAALREDEG